MPRRPMPSITRDQIAVVEASFDSFYPDAYDAVASTFYEELFRRDKALRALFPDNLHEQRRKLMMAFNIAVHGLRHPRSILPALSELGHIHAQLGIQRSHYLTMEEALLATVQQHAGPSWTVDAAAAWQAAFSLIVETMMTAGGADQ
jgi:hemoglobin-like flavoprotein